MAKTALKHEHMISKFNPGIKIMKKITAQRLPRQKNYFLRISFQLLHTDFSDCARITKCAQ